MLLPSVKDLKLSGKRVLLRTNYDVPLKKVQSAKCKVQSFEVADATRIEESLPTIKYLLGQNARIIIISHLGRPGGKVVSELSLAPVRTVLEKLVGHEVKLLKIKQAVQLSSCLADQLILLENLRFYPKEEENDSAFAKDLASLADFYVNDAFACSHRQHASIVGLPHFLPSAFGLDMAEEVRVLSEVREKPKRPVVLLLGGVKQDKIEAARKLASWADWILIGGKLIEYDGVPELIDHPKIVGSLVKSGQDINPQTIREFKKIIFRAKTIIWAGPMGNFYQPEFAVGTKEIGQAVVESKAFTIVGGGDTEAALDQFGLVKKISFVSSGGGAMLTFLAEGTLPGIRAIIKKE